MEVNYDLEQKAAVDELLLDMPGVKGGKAFGYPAYKVNGKVFAFVGSNGMAIKLTEKRVSELIGTHPHFQPFHVADGIVWKAWLSIQPEEPAEYAQHEALYQESLTLVAGG